MTSETEAGAVDSLKAQMEELTRMVHNLTDARSNRKQIRCWNCGELGHTKNRCQSQKAAENLEWVGASGQMPTLCQAPDNINYDTSVQYRSDSICVHGHIEATGESAAIHGEVQMSLTIGRTRIEHWVLVADIEEEVMLGVDVMRPHGFNLDLENGVIRVGSDEIVLQYHKDMACCLVLAEETTVPSRAERIVFARLEKKVKEGSILMTEPNSPDNKVSRGNLVVKELVKAREAIPVDLTYC
ncbi:Zinc knuckle [Popillia japonica]|uniref:Zinc knuckle n=1 Tax=Popillia japonica TaxID=7064 RepID=A0AAW1MQG7_POPJA